MCVCGGGGSNLQKGRLPIPNIPGDEWENQNAPGGKTLVGCSKKNHNINLDVGFTAIKAQENQDFF